MKAEQICAPKTSLVGGDILVSMVLCLRALETTVVPQSAGNSVHALLLSWVKEKDKDLSKQWHDSSNLKPFSVSPIMGKFAKTSLGRLIVKDHPYWLKIGLLNKRGFDVLGDVLFPLAAIQGKIAIGGAEFVLEEVKLRGHPWASILNWDELLTLDGALHYDTAKKDIPNFDNMFSFRFLTPTTFRRGDKNRIVPDPELVFGSLLDRWNAYAPEKFPAELKQRFASEIIISRISIKSDLYELKHQSMLGFIGLCAYTVVDSDTGLMSVIQKLSSFAIFCGVGQKTTMGMGVCRALN
ncbi:MAG: CRISPR-associated endoribonuclease Cas6 [Paenibacillus sp.]|nr:CRISPR-associated endoribonuclease Cas6 [Paenibacillus sp.]